MRTIKSLFVLLVVVIVGMFLHRYILGSIGAALRFPEYLLSYGLNFVMAATIIIALLNLPERFKTSLGYFFLFGSFFKFIVYFTVFLPIYRRDGDVSSIEFFAFFVPYALCLVVETTVLIVKLNHDDRQSE